MSITKIKARMIFIFGLFFHYLHGQTNLIPNPSFEHIDSCYFQWNSNCIISSCGLIYYSGWNCVYTSSPDLFSAFSSTQNFQIPNNYYGYQFPQNGDAYCGIGGGIYLAPISNYEEQITAKLSSLLVSSKKYCLTFYCSPSYRAKLFFSRIGAIFTSDSVNLLPGGQYPFQGLQPQIINNSFTNPITDTSNWTVVRGSFISQGDESFISLGHFQSDLQLSQWDTIRHGYNFSGPPDPNYYSYYIYIDDLYLYELKALHSTDTLVCADDGFPIPIKAYPGFDSYVWNTGDTSRIININSIGDYVVTASNWCGTVTDTLRVRYMYDTTYTLQQGNYTPCQSHIPITIDAPPWAHEAVWSTGDTSLTTSINQSGVYTVNVFDGCFFHADTFTVNVASNPMLSLGNDTLVCDTDILELQGPPGYSYNWNTGSTGISTLASTDTYYSLTITDANGCTATDGRWVILYHPDEFVLSLGNDTGYCEGGNGVKITAVPHPSNYSSFVWNNGSGADTLLAQQEGWYYATGVHPCGTYRDSVYIEEYPKPQPNLGKDTTLCIGQSMVLNPGSFYRYSWSNGETTQSISIDVADHYSVEVSTSEGCINSDTVMVLYETEVMNLLPSDTALTLESFPFTIATLINLQQQQWQDGSTDSSMMVYEAGIYFIQGITQEGCIVSDTIRITVIEKEKEKMWIPGVLTFGTELEIANLKPNTSIRVYNALGQLIYLQEQYKNKWTAQPAPGIYFVELQHPEEGVIRGKVWVE